MATYLAVLQQSGGCDYTIGCGIKTVTINDVGSYLEAMEKLAKQEYWSDAMDSPEDYSMNPLEDEGRLSKVVIFKIEDDDGGDTFNTYHARMKQVFDASRVDNERKRDEAEFERLRAKLEK